MTGGTVYPLVVEVLSAYAPGVRTVVELGCGAKQYTVFGPDVTYVGIDLRSDLYGGSGPDVISDAQGLPFLHETADIVFVVAAFYLIDDVDAVMSEARRILRTGGSFVVFDYGWLASRRLGGKHLLSTQRLVAMFQRHRFSTTVHRNCIPLHGPRLLRSIVSIGVVQKIAYYLGRWIIVAGLKT